MQSITQRQVHLTIHLERDYTDPHSPSPEDCHESFHFGLGCSGVRCRLKVGENDNHPADGDIRWHETIYQGQILRWSDSAILYHIVPIDPDSHE